MNQILNRWLEWAVTSGLRMLLILGGLLLILWLMRAGTARLRALLDGVAASPEQATRAATLTHIVRDMAMIFVVAVGAMMVLAELGVDLRPILTAAGIGDLAIGFDSLGLFTNPFLLFIALCVWIGAAQESRVNRKAILDRSPAWPGAAGPLGREPRSPSSGRCSPTRVFR